MRQVLAMYPLASAIRYGPFFAGYWNSLVSLVHGAKHFGSELAVDTTFGGAAVTTPAATSALTATRARVRYGIRASLRAGIAAIGGAANRDRLAAVPAGDLFRYGEPPTSCTTRRCVRQASGGLWTDGSEIQLGWRAAEIASSSAAGSCAPETAILPSKMKNGTPRIPTSSASRLSLPTSCR